MRQRLFAIGGFMLLFPGLLAAQDGGGPDVAR